MPSLQLVVVIPFRKFLLNSSDLVVPKACNAAFASYGEICGSRSEVKVIAGATKLSKIARAGAFKIPPISTPLSISASFTPLLIEPIVVTGTTLSGIILENNEWIAHHGYDQLS